MLRKRFSKQANSYDQYAHVQKKMANQLLQRAGERTLGKVRKILEIGCGTGYVTKRLVEQFPDASITAVDLAPGMIDVAKRKCNYNKVNYLCADIEEMEIDQKYDLIISNATFQWFNRFEETVNKLCDALTEDGVLAFSTFGERTFYELHMSFEQALAQHELNDESRRLGQSFPPINSLQWFLPSAIHFDWAEEEIIEYFPTVRAFFQSVKKIGANNSNKGAYMQRPSVFKSLIQTYETTYRKNDLIPATYHCLYVRLSRRPS